MHTPRIAVRTKAGGTRCVEEVAAAPGLHGSALAPSERRRREATIRKFRMVRSVGEPLAAPRFRVIQPLPVSRRWQRSGRLRMSCSHIYAPLDSYPPKV